MSETTSLAQDSTACGHSQGASNMNTHPQVSTVQVTKSEASTEGLAGQNEVVSSARKSHALSLKEEAHSAAEQGLTLESEDGVCLPSGWPKFPHMFSKDAYFLVHLRVEGVLRKILGGRVFKTKRKTGSCIEVRRK